MTDEAAVLTYGLYWEIYDLSITARNIYDKRVRAAEASQSGSCPAHGIAITSSEKNDPTESQTERVPRHGRGTRLRRSRQALEN